MNVWLPVFGPTLVALALLFLPGVATTNASGMRGLRAWALAPGVSLGIIAVSALVWSALKVPWNVAAVIILTIVLVGLAVALRLLFRWRQWGWRNSPAAVQVNSPVRRKIAPYAVAYLAGFALCVVTFAVMFCGEVHSPYSFGNVYDSVFHFDVLRWILETHDGSSFKTGYMDGSANASGFYPAAWHDSVALVEQLTSGGLPLSVSAVTIAIAVVIWPLSNVLLVTTLFSKRPVAIFATLAVSNLLWMFPWHFISWGQLYSNQMAMAVLPAGLAVLISVFESWRKIALEKWLLTIAIALVTAAGLALAQPNTLFAVVIFFVPYFVGFLWSRSRRSDGTRRPLLGAVLVIVFLLVVAVAWRFLFHAQFMQRTVTWVWPPFQSTWDAIVAYLLNGTNGHPVQLLVVVPSTVGAVMLFIRRQHRWLLASYVWFGVLYVVSASTNTYWTHYIAGFWYTDYNRIAGFAVPVLVPLMAIGVLAIADAVVWTARRVGARENVRQWISMGVAALLAVVLVGCSMAAPAMAVGRDEMQKTFAHDGRSLVTPAELKFLAKVARVVPQGSVVANQPEDGSGFGYALYGTKMLFPAMPGNWLGQWSEEKAYFGDHLTSISTDARECELASKFHVKYVLRLQPGLFAPFGHSAMPHNLIVPDGTPGFEVVLHEGEMSLMRITACG